MGFLKINLSNIDSPNDFIVSYKSGESVGNLNTGFVRYPNDERVFSGGTTEIIVSGITLNYGEQYWFKIEEYNTGRTDNPFIIENINMNYEEYFTYYCPPPIPTPTPTRTPTPTPTTGPAPTQTSTPTLTPTLTSTPTLTPTQGTTPEPTSTPTPTPTPTPTLTPTATKLVNLFWEYTDGTNGGDKDSPYINSYWNLFLSEPLEGFESITLNIQYKLNNQAVDASQQRSIFSLSEGVLSGNIIGSGNIGQDSLITTFPNDKTGNLTHTLTASNQYLRLGLSASIDGDMDTMGTIVANITDCNVSSYLVNTTYDGINPSVSVTSNVGQYWYQLFRCDTETTWYAGPYTDTEMFSLGTRVEGATNVFYVISGTVLINPGSVITGITDTGFMGCP